MKNNEETKQEEKGDSNKVKKKVKTQTKEQPWYIWPIKIFFLALARSLSFSILSELAMSNAGIIISIIVVLVFISISVITDMIGVAVASCSEEPFKAMASRKVRGAKEALILVKNADRVASLCADVLGDVCGILAGAGGSSILYHIVTDASTDAFEIVMASVVSAVIAGLTIFGKAIFKRYSMENCNKVILTLGKCLSIFTRNRKDKKKGKQTKKTEVKDEKEKVENNVNSEEKN